MQPSPNESMIMTDIAYLSRTIALELREEGLIADFHMIRDSSGHKSIASLSLDDGRVLELWTGDSDSEGILPYSHYLFDIGHVMNQEFSGVSQGSVDDVMVTVKWLIRS